MGAFGERPDMAVEMDRQDGEIEGQMLDIEAGVSRNRPDRKSSVAFTWRKEGQWEDETVENSGENYEEENELVLSPHDEQLRPRNDRGFYSFDKQLGRIPQSKQEEE